MSCPYLIAGKRPCAKRVGHPGRHRPASHKEVQAQYAARNRQRLNAYQREWARRNPEKRRAIEQRYDSNHLAKRMIINMRAEAKRRGNR